MARIDASNMELQERVVTINRVSKTVKGCLLYTSNTYDVLNAGKFIIAKDAVAKLEEVYA